MHTYKKLQTAVNFGLINQTYPTDAEYDPEHEKTQWQRFEHLVFRLNRQSGRNVQYKVLFMGRHGEGYHNAAEYGFQGVILHIKLTSLQSILWYSSLERKSLDGYLQTFRSLTIPKCYWSEKDGNATVSWADAHLTPKGIQQALTANRFWASEIVNQKIPTPETFYTSPLDRCLETANLTFKGLNLPKHKPFIPTVKEYFREGISGHTCDRRSNKTWIHENFPTYQFENNFTETDLLWQAFHGETSTDEDIRSKIVLDDVFSHDDSTFISITSHSGEISSILRGTS